MPRAGNAQEWAYGAKCDANGDISSAMQCGLRVDRRETRVNLPTRANVWYHPACDGDDTAARLTQGNGCPHNKSC